MSKWKRTKGQAMIHKTLHRKITIKWHESSEKKTSCLYL